MVETPFRSRAVRGVVRMEVYLPADYTTSGKRYPVVYFLHGLPASGTSYRGVDFLRRALDRAEQSTILVAPQGARDHDSDPEYLDWGPAETGRRRSDRSCRASSTGTSGRSATGAVARSSASRPAVTARRSSPSTTSRPLPSSSRGAGTSTPRTRAARRRSTSAHGRRTRERARTRTSAPCAAPSAAGRPSSPSTSGTATRASAPRTSVCTASSSPQACRTSSGSSPAPTRRRCGAPTRRPGYGSRWLTWPRRSGRGSAGPARRECRARRGGRAGGGYRSRPARPSDR